MILYNTPQICIYTRTSQKKYVNSKEMCFMVGVNLELSMSDLPSHSGISINISKYVSTLRGKSMHLTLVFQVSTVVCSPNMCLCHSAITQLLQPSVILMQQWALFWNQSVKVIVCRELTALYHLSRWGINLPFLPSSAWVWCTQCKRCYLFVHMHTLWC